MKRFLSWNVWFALMMTIKFELGPLAINHFPGFKTMLGTRKCSNVTEMRKFCFHDETDDVSKE